MYLSNSIFTDFFTVVTKVPLGETNIKRSLEDFKYGYRISGDIKDCLHPDERIIHNTKFRDDKEYKLYYEMQQNYETFLRIVSTRAMPVLVRSEIKKYNKKLIPGGSTFDSFGSNVKKTGNLYLLKFSTEMTNAWPSQEMLSETLNNVPVIGEYSSFVTEGDDLNIIIKKSKLDD